MPHISPFLPPLESKILSEERSVLIDELLLEVGIFVLDLVKDTFIVVILVIIIIVIVIIVVIDLSRLLLVRLTTRFLFRNDCMAVFFR